MDFNSTTSVAIAGAYVQIILNLSLWLRIFVVDSERVVSTVVKLTASTAIPSTERTLDIKPTAGGLVKPASIVVHSKGVVVLKPAEGKLTKEMILCFGPYSGGKTNNWATLRKWGELTNSPSKFYIISTEHEMAHRTAEAYMDGTPGNNFFTNAEITEVTDYETLLATSLKYREIGTEDDWIIVDSVGHPLTWARDVWFRQHFDMTWKEFQASGRKISEVKPENWTQMSSLYKDWLIPNILRFPGHRYAAAQADVINTQGSWADSPAIQKMYGRIGAKPVGDKELGYAFHTVLFCTQRGADDWRMTTVDDPGRQYLVDEAVTDFVTTYLCGVAGWQFT